MSAISMPREEREERIRRIRDTFIMLVWVVTRRFSQELQSFGLTLPQFIALATLAASKEPCTMSDLTKATLQDPPTTTGITNRLVKMKLAQRTRSQTDRRVVLVQATPAGVELLKRIRDQVLESSMSNYLALADDDELADLDRLLAFFEQSLKYILRAHLKQHHSLDATDLEAEIEKIQLFLKSPVGESERDAQERTVPTNHLPTN